MKRLSLLGLLVSSCVLPSIALVDSFGAAGAGAEAQAGSAGASAGGTEANGGALSTLPGAGTVSGGASDGGTAGKLGQSGTGGSIETGGAGEGGAAGLAGQPNVATGHFKVLAYYETRGFVHASVQAGLQMLEELGAANDFEVVRSNGEQTDLTDPQITSAGLAPFDMLFFMNTSGDLFTDPEKQIVMDFLHEKKAFAGVHAAADTERNWAWYHELVGAFFDSHSSGLQPASMTLEPGVNHPALAGLPNPWARAEEWFTFNSFAGGQTPTGLQVLLRYGSAPLTNGPATGQPLAWAREWEGIRSFYTALGHDPAAFGETLVRKHVLGGILWAARRLDP